MIMANAMLLNLTTENEELQKSLDNIENLALEQKRGLTSADLELIERTKTRQTDIVRQIEILAKEADMSDAAKQRVALLRNGVQTSSSAVEYRSAAEYLYDFVMADIAQDHKIKSECRNRLDTYNRAAAHVTTDAFEGIFPNSVVGPVVSFIDASRPLFNAVGAKSIPGGPSFRRPRLVDDHLADGVGPQAAQKDELVSHQFTITSDNVDLTTLGGYVNVARQVFDWGVASLGTIVDQLAARYAYYTERALITEIQKSTGAVPLAADADAAATVEAIYDAAALYYAATGTMPSILAAGPNGWARLGGLSDSAGRQVFPFLSPSNAAGGGMSATSFAGNPVGLRLVVTPGIADEALYVTGDLAIEAYEQTVGQLSVVEPSVLGVQISYSGYVGFYRPAPNGTIKIG
jgi:HK97 family phage major capsid protein